MTVETYIAQWIMPAIGTLLLALIGLLGRIFLTRMDKQDQSLMDIKDLLASEVKLLRDSMHELDKRVIWIESTCLQTHGKESPFLGIGNNK